LAVQAEVRLLSDDAHPSYSTSSRIVTDDLVKEEVKAFADWIF